MHFYFHCHRYIIYAQMFRRQSVPFFLRPCSSTVPAIRTSNVRRRRKTISGKFKGAFEISIRVGIEMTTEFSKKALKTVYVRSNDIPLLLLLPSFPICLSPQALLLLFLELLCAFYVCLTSVEVGMSTEEEEKSVQTVREMGILRRQRLALKFAPLPLPSVSLLLFSFYFERTRLKSSSSSARS